MRHLDLEQWRMLLEAPDLIPKAVEELIRTGMPGGIGAPRYAREDTSVGDVTILVLLDPGSANHDPAVFPDPNRLDIHRTGSSHVGLGTGLHCCVGAALARMELNIVLAQLIPRFPHMQLAVEAATLTARFHSLSHGLVALPVSW